MSSRRLALRQPDSFELSKPALKEIKSWVSKFPKGRARSAMIPALWIAQKDAGGWLPEPALRAVGDMLDMAYIRVYEVATFYTMFNLSPVGEHHVQLCGTTPCWLRGANDLKAVCKSKIGENGSISADGKLSWIEVECLGACANAPMVQISNASGDHYYEDLTVETMETLLDDLAAGKSPAQGSRIDRQGSEPIGGAAALLDDSIFKSLGKLKKLPDAGVKSNVSHFNRDAKSARLSGYGGTKTAAKPAVKAKPAKSGGEAEPQVIYTDGPTDGAPDDLKKIKGIGPKFEGDLNEKGIYYFAQIGAWKAADIKMIEADALSRYPGRIKRDEWVKQGKALAKSAQKEKGKS